MLFSHCSKVSSVLETQEDELNGAKRVSGQQTSFQQRAGGERRSSWDNCQHGSNSVASFSSSGSYFLHKMTAISMDCHLLIEVIWEFSQRTNHKIGPCIVFSILSFNKTFYKLRAYLLTSSSPSWGPAACPVVHNALAAGGEL